MTNDQQKELKRQLQALNNYGSYSFERRIKRAIPLSKEEKRAMRVLKVADNKRKRIVIKISKQFAKLQDEARKAVYFSGDPKIALKKLEIAQKFASDHV